MKIRVTVKNPDCFGDAVEEAVREELASRDLDEEEREAVFDVKMEKVWKKLEKWVKWHEYITLEFDTEEGTAVVLPAAR